MKLINLTPHDVIIGGVVIPPSGSAPRVETQSLFVGTVPTQYGDVPLYETVTGAVSGLPDPELGTAFVVGLVVAQAVPERDDLLVPHGLIRDERGAVIGAKGLARIAPPSREAR